MINRRSNAFLLSVVLAACGGGGGGSNQGGGGGTGQAAGGEQQQGTAQTTSNAPEDAAAAGDAESTASTSPAPAESVQVVAGTITDIPAGLHPRVEILEPRNNALIHTNSVQVRLHVTDWPAPEGGKHIHLILDNEPYRRVDDPSRPQAFENLSEGVHVLRAFPGWHTHESVKRDGAFAMVVFHVGNMTDNLHFDPHAPVLTYSRPKGDYNGADADHILLDFYLTNIPNNQLSPTGYRVRYSLDGSTTGEATQWVPYYIDHLPDGAHTIVLDLLGPDGNVVAGPFNHTERTIHVNHSAATTDEHAHAQAGASTAPSSSASPETTSAGGASASPAPATAGHHHGHAHGH